MGERAMLPHDRGHLLWTSEDGASRMLTSSMDRWTTAIVGDDGIDGPVMGFGEKVTAHVTSRADGTIAGAAAVDDMNAELRAAAGTSVLWCSTPVTDAVSMFGRSSGFGSGCSSNGGRI